MPHCLGFVCCSLAPAGGVRTSLPPQPSITPVARPDRLKRMASRVFERIADGYPRCENVFQGTPFEHAVNEADTRCVGLKVPEFIPHLTATKWYHGALSMMASHGAPLSRPPNSTAICAGYQYRTARFMRFPCTCSLRST